MAQQSKDFPPDVLHTNSTIGGDGKTPLVFWHLNGQEGTLTLTAARARAEILLSVAAMADAEGRIAARLSGADQLAKPKGFANKKEQKAISEAREVFCKMLQCMADVRPDLPEGIVPGYGFNKKKPVVKIEWYGEEIVWQPSQARDHALVLLTTAEGAESDRFFYEFLNDVAGLEQGDVAGLIQDFALFRQRRQLSDSMKL